MYIYNAYYILIDRVIFYLQHPIFVSLSLSLPILISLIRCFPATSIFDEFVVNLGQTKKYVGSQVSFSKIR